MQTVADKRPGCLFYLINEYMTVVKYTHVLVRYIQR